MVREQLVKAIHLLGLVVDAVEQTTVSACLFANAALDAAFDLIIEKV